MKGQSTKQVAWTLKNVNVMKDKKAEELKDTIDMHHPYLAPGSNNWKSQKEHWNNWGKL